MRGFAAWTAKQRGVELHVSHWSGELPKLEVYRHWTYGRSTQGMFGRLLYRGQPVFGTRTPSATVRDEWARNVSIDTFNSDYGPGWKHDTAMRRIPAAAASVTRSSGRRRRVAARRRSRTGTASQAPPSIPREPP